MPNVLPGPNTFYLMCFNASKEWYNVMGCLSAKLPFETLNVHRWQHWFLTDECHWEFFCGRNMSHFWGNFNHQLEWWYLFVPFSEGGAVHFRWIYWESICIKPIREWCYCVFFCACLGVFFVFLRNASSSVLLSVAEYTFVMLTNNRLDVCSFGMLCSRQGRGGGRT